jgi:hypothetical protein
MWQRKPKRPEKSVRDWHRQWIEAGEQPGAMQRISQREYYAGVSRAKQERAPGRQGEPVSCNWVRENVYEWFVAMRYSIAWRKYNAAVRSCGRYKAMGRFPMALYYKAKQFSQDYLRICFVSGIRPAGVEIAWKWLKRWQVEYGLRMRAPNRKFKVAKEVLEERLTIWWLNLARVRALCQEVRNYDTEMENWDQIPFRHNEIGSQNSKTLAIRGAIEVPLVEGHSDTRSRWTANLTTCSNEECIQGGEFPYAEFMFKADGEVLRAQLRDHLRSRGYGSWASAATSEKASYRKERYLGVLR